MFIRCMQTDRINFMKFCRHITVLSQMSTYFWDRPRIVTLDNIVQVQNSTKNFREHGGLVLDCYTLNPTSVHALYPFASNIDSLKKWYFSDLRKHWLCFEMTDFFFILKGC